MLGQSTNPKFGKHLGPRSGGIIVKQAMEDNQVRKALGQLVKQTLGLQALLYCSQSSKKRKGVPPTRRLDASRPAHTMVHENVGHRSDARSQRKPRKSEQHIVGILQTLKTQPVLHGEISTKELRPWLRRTELKETIRYVIAIERRCGRDQIADEEESVGPPFPLRFKLICTKEHHICVDTLGLSCNTLDEVGLKKIVGVQEEQVLPSRNVHAVIARGTSALLKGVVNGLDSARARFIVDQDFPSPIIRSVINADDFEIR